MEVAKAVGKAVGKVVGKVVARAVAKVANRTCPCGFRPLSALATALATSGDRFARRLPQQEQRRAAAGAAQWLSEVSEGGV